MRQPQTFSYFTMQTDSNANIAMKFRAEFSECGSQEHSPGYDPLFTLNAPLSIYPNFFHFCTPDIIFMTSETKL